MIIARHFWLFFLRCFSSLQGPFSSSRRRSFQPFIHTSDYSLQGAKFSPRADFTSFHCGRADIADDVRCASNRPFFTMRRIFSIFGVDFSHFIRLFLSFPCLRYFDIIVFSLVYRIYYQAMSALFLFIGTLLLLRAHVC